VFAWHDRKALAVLAATSWWHPKKLAPYRQLPNGSAAPNHQPLQFHHRMTDKEEVNQLRVKVKAYEVALAQRESECKKYQDRIAQLELKVKAYEERGPAHVFEPTTPAIRNKRSNTSGDERPAKVRQAPRWIAAGERFLENIGKNKVYMEVTCLQNNELLHLDGSTYDRAKIMAKRASSTLDTAAHAADIAQIELFFFLSALRVLDRRGTLSPNEINEILNLVEGNTRSFKHRRGILFGAEWIHKTLIFPLFETGWDMGHAIAVVAKSKCSPPFGRNVKLISIADCPITPSQYEHLRYERNVKRLIEALQNAKQDSEQFKCIGWHFFSYVRLWDPWIR
jgi:hypothetical protein